MYHRSFSTAANMQFYTATFLHFIVGVDNNCIEEEVNKLIAETGVDAHYKRKEAHAVAVPLNYQGKFCSVIVFGKSIVPNNPKGFDFSNVSAFLEELLHVKLYEATHENREFHTKDSSRLLAKLTIDEYIVGRWKYNILVDIFGSLDYNQDLFPEFYDLEHKLFSIIHNAAAKHITIDDACNTLGAVLYRDFLEPLTRYSNGFDSVKGMPEIPIEKYPFLYEVAYDYWKMIHTQLKLCFDNVNDIEKHINNADNN